MKADFNSKAFNAQQRRNRKRRDAICAAVAELPQGQDLLDMARELKIQIRVLDEFKMPKCAAEIPQNSNIAGFFINDFTTGRMQIQLLARNSDEDLVPFLVHELRHMQQTQQLGANPLLVAMPNMREVFLIQRVMEADAQVFTYIFCATLAQQGKPQFLQAFLGASEGAARFNPSRPYAGWGDFCRALFETFQQKETFGYDDSMRLKMEVAMRRYPESFAYPRKDLSAIFNFKVGMRDLCRMTAIDGKSYLSGMTRLELEGIVAGSMRLVNSRFLRSYDVFLKSNAYVEANENKPLAAPQKRKAISKG